MKSSPNKTIVGIIATFAGGPGVSRGEAPRVRSSEGFCTDNETDKRQTHTELTSLAALSMSLGIDEETVEESDEEDEGESEDYEEADDEMYEMDDVDE